MKGETIDIMERKGKVWGFGIKGFVEVGIFVVESVFKRFKRPSRSIDFSLIPIPP